MGNGLLSKAFSVATDQQQAEMINEMARELFVRCGGRRQSASMDGYENQVCNLSKYLNADGVAFIDDLYAFVELRRKDMK